MAPVAAEHADYAVASAAVPADHHSALHPTNHDDDLGFARWRLSNWRWTCLVDALAQGRTTATANQTDVRQGAIWTDQTANHSASVRIQQAETAPRGMSAHSTPRSAINPAPASSSANRLKARLRANAGVVAQSAQPEPTALPVRFAQSLPKLMIAANAEASDHHDDSVALPSPGSYARITFSDHLTALEVDGSATQPSYRNAIDQLLSTLAQSATVDVPLLTLVAGTDVGVGVSSTALSLAYRAADTGTRTLLIDACSADAHLSQRLARSLIQSRPCVLDSEEHLAEITMQDPRTGLSLLPLAFTNLGQFNADQQTRLLVGLRKLSTRYELVVIDVGAPTTNQGAVFLGAFADRLLVVTHDTVSDPLLTAANFGVSNTLTTVVTTPAG
jgi:Mrp family chromosome partitioning ATPase